MFTDGIFTLITSNTQLAALIGSRCYPVKLPQRPTLPAVVYSTIATTPDPTITSAGLQKVRLQIDAYGEVYSDVTSITEALRQLLDGYTGTLSDGTQLQNCYRFNAMDMSYEDSPREYRYLSEFYLFFNFSS